MPALAPQEIYDKPLQKMEKQMSATGIQGPPEITGQEEMMLFLD
jgi:hypothetical protein